MRPVTSIFFPSGHFRKFPFLIFLCSFLAPLFYTTSFLDNDTIQRVVFLVFITISSLCLLCTPAGSASVRINLPVAIILLLLLMLLAVSSATNNAFEFFLTDFFQWILYFNFMLLALLFNLMHEKHYMLYTAWAVMITGIIVSFIGILQSLGVKFFNLHEIIRPGSTLLVTVFAAEYIVGVIPWVFIAYALSGKKVIKGIILFILFIIVTYFLFTRGRAGYAAFMSGLFILAGGYFIFLRKKIPFRTLRKDLLAIGVVLGCSFAAGMQTTPYLYRRDLRETAVSVVKLEKDRVDYWMASLKMFSETPLMGIGPGTWFGHYPKYSGARFTDKNIYNSRLNPHNDYIEILSETGIFSLILYLALLLLILLNLFKRCKDNPVLLPVAASFISIAVASCFSFTRDRIAPMALFFLAAGISLNETGMMPVVKIKIALLRLIVMFIFLTCAFFLFRKLSEEKLFLGAMSDKFSGNYTSMNRKLHSINKYIFPADFSQIPVYYYMGVGYFEMQDYDSAVYYFRETCRLSPFTPTVLHNLASANYRSGKVHEAGVGYDFLKKIFPNYYQPQIDFIAMATNEKKYDDAILWMKELDVNSLKAGSWNQWQTSTSSGFFSLNDTLINHPVYGQVKQYYLFNNWFGVPVFYMYSDSPEVFRSDGDIRSRFCNITEFQTRVPGYGNPVIIPKKFISR